MANLVQQYIDIAKKRNPGEPEFLQTVEEVLTSIEPVLEAHPEYIEAGLIERLIEPERGISFRVSWVDDNGKVCLLYTSRIPKTLRLTERQQKGP